MTDASPSPAKAVQQALLTPARAPRGVKNETMELIAKVAGGPLVRDLVFLPPHSAIDRRLRVPIGETNEGDIATIEAEVDGHIPARRIGQKVLPHRVRLRDETGFLTVAYFRGAREMIERMWPVGQTRIVSGEIKFYEGMRQMLHPDHVVDPAKGEAPPAVEPIYPLTQGLPGRTLARAILGALDCVPVEPEWFEV
jgi:ATP-dependent DNA helicase RecG